MNLSIKMSDIKPSSTLAITAKAKQMKADGIDIVGFGAGEPDFDTPEHIKQAAIDAIESGFTKYTPATGILELKKAICNKLKRDNGLTYEPSQIVVSNGAKHSLTNTFMAILRPGDEVMIPAPFWLSYPQMVKMADGIPVIVKASKENDYKVTVDQLEAKVTTKTKAILINSPSNPTGMVYSKEELSSIAEFAVKHDLFIISDEIYEKLLYDGKEHISITSFGDEVIKRTIIINGVSKSYSMTGWRIGYAAAPLEIAKIMGNMQSHASSNPNAIAQKAALAAIAGPQECVGQMLVHFEDRRNYMVERLSKVKDISFVRPSGAFYVFIDISKLLGKTYKDQPLSDAKEFARVLLEDKSVAVIPCADFGFADHIRLSYAISKENIKKGLDRLEEFINAI
ncbi:pyridoxal phosphate-dependent aminotransferase [Vallitalea okinawensis]|uniref:pyridoxal phosphate-dependent aminotransferase n=1 Tax=Vallitalea okinawensis TaxID=2078660 RepID=UPI000CFAF12B|nr:pyridoxal phosphate-dependent aminotransferase [Vallitalea okinawensis]